MIRVLIASGIRLYREGLAQILGHIDLLSVVGQVSDRDIALAYLGDAAPDVILLDMSTPENLALVRRVRELTPSIPVVALGIEESELLACAEAGVVGYVTREGSLDELLAAMCSVVRGELVCSPRIAGSLVRRLAALADERARSLPEPPLTTRECEIVNLLEEHLSNKEIAARLDIEVATVKNHVHNLLEKLNVHRRADAAHLVGRARRGTPPGGLSRR
jgi:DNA-binding NarL/FixJ family response regulator